MGMKNSWQRGMKNIIIPMSPCTQSLRNPKIAESVTLTKKNRPKGRFFIYAAPDYCSAGSPIYIMSP